jgi:hypothetical protein
MDLLGVWVGAGAGRSPGRRADHHVDPFFATSFQVRPLSPSSRICCVGGMFRRAAATRGDAGVLELLADRAPLNAQFGTGLAQGPAVGV